MYLKQLIQLANNIEEHVDEKSDIESKFSDVKVIDDCIKRIYVEINVPCEDDSTATIRRRGGNVNSLTEATVVRKGQMRGFPVC